MLLPVWLHKRDPDTHKGDFGHIFVLGGSLGLTGAVCLTAKAGLKIGAGLVTVGIPCSLNSILEIKLTEVMTLPLPETAHHTLAEEAYSKIEEFIEKIDVLAIGGGASRDLSTQKLILKVVSQINRSMVIDADGINAVATNIESLQRRREKAFILTPHLGEFSRLVKKEVNYLKKRGKELAKNFAFRYNLILVLKGHRTIVTDGKEIFENTTGNPGMATAGSGDVLTGIIAGLVAEGMDAFNSAKLGVYLHGLAGDLAAEDKTQAGLVASDIIEYLPKAIKSLVGKSILN
ncbi:MAG: NAD(P)H-hydrate dehydratase [Candidatus Omnitrophica bacterium 4484_70.2]|nr:MAG: NAD(P)H-hydrate dehydratase [Candidatus Omnitrophica bacterium 4484_70.2]